MTTYTIQGFSRVVDYETGLYGDYRSSTIELVRQDGDTSFVYHYGWIDETGSSPKFANIEDHWSGSVLLTRSGDAPLQMLDESFFIEKQVYQVTWAPGQTAYVLGFFQPVEGVETIFFMGGSIPAITDLASLNSFLALPQDYIMEGPFEGGEDISLGGFANLTTTEDDVLTGVEGAPLYWSGGVGNDTLTGTAENDRMNGGAGDDVLTTGGGADSIWGGLGNDMITGGGNFTFMSGGAGNDTLIGGSQFGEFQNGGSGDDLIVMTNGQDLGDGYWVSHANANGGSGHDTIIGGLAGDNAFGGNGNDLMTGNEGSDWFSGGAGADTLRGDAGDDNLAGGAGADSLEGGIGNDVLEGGTEGDTLRGQDGNDVLSGGDGLDYMYGGWGNDTGWGGLGNDRMFGDANADTLYGEDGNDQISGGSQADFIEGGEGNDLLKGDGGNDVIYGGEGRDTLLGGADADELEGEGGADEFRYTAVSESTLARMDTIYGFEIGVDVIDLSRIDAITGAGATGNQAFTFIGADAFTAAGQLRVYEDGGNTVIEANNTGIANAEMVIYVAGMTGLTADDFIL